MLETSCSRGSQLLLVYPCRRTESISIMNSRIFTWHPLRRYYATGLEHQSSTTHRYFIICAPARDRTSLVGFFILVISYTSPRTFLNASQLLVITCYKHASHIIITTRQSVCSSLSANSVSCFNKTMPLLVLHVVLEKDKQRNQEGQVPTSEWVVLLIRCMAEMH
jgi:hypothetical protein